MFIYADMMVKYKEDDPSSDTILLTDLKGDDAKYLEFNTSTLQSGVTALCLYLQGIKACLYKQK